MEAHRIASSSWVGTWARFRTLGEVAAASIGPSAEASPRWRIIEGASWVRFAQVDDLDAFEMTQPVIADPDGDLVIIERAHDGRGARLLVDTFVLGDARQSAAAKQALEEAARAV